MKHEHTYRLSPDFQLPKPKRWLYNSKYKTIQEDYYSSELQQYHIEIPAEDIEYVKKCIELHNAGAINLDEFEIRMVRLGELYDWLSITFPYHRKLSMIYSNGMLFVHKPAKEQGRYVEYPIYIDEGEYRCNVKHHYNSGGAALHVLPSIVGFAGYKFLLEDGTESDWLEDVPFILHDGRPATPVAARFYIKGESKCA